MEDFIHQLAWLGRAQLIFLILHTFVRKFGRVKAATRKKNETLETFTFLSNLHSLNLVNTIL